MSRVVRKLDPLDPPRRKPSARLNPGRNRYSPSVVARALADTAISRQLRKNWTMNPWRVEIEWWIDPISIARKIAAACPTCAKASTFP
jgi:hypothetical protein